MKSKYIIQKLKNVNTALVKKNKKLKNQIDEATFKLIKDKKKVQFYTGLPDIHVFKHVFNLIENYVPANNASTMTKLQEFCIVLMKLRLNLLEQDIAYRFGISKPTVSRIFEKWLLVMARRLSFLIKWPERDILRRTMLTCFREFFPKCIVIIDCFEIFIEKPKDLTARAQTFSKYKHHNTVKVLIGITPQGSISFVSEAWGGRVSDVYITENSGILNNLLIGDQVLADRFYNCRFRWFILCRIKTSCFYTRKVSVISKFSKKEVDWTREIARVRIHFERLIGLLRNKYTLLQGILPNKLISRTDDGICKLNDILTVCSALCNLCCGVVPID
ncbi:uncharacterized protein LOC136089529 [Hydra vulgaris]|uniref:Uncharacterized protein LOC136089529 n=1 Tax=Hydra vulgaris TaxID=6087 RepID=A0ABM4DBB6_HYDVU